MGGAALRSGALSDEETIQFINANFVATWVNVRSQPVPQLPDDRILLGVKINDARFVTGSFNEGFFVRSLVVSPDGKTLLNPQAMKPEESMPTYREHGYFPYGQVKAKDYLPMLRDALARLAPP